MTGERPAIDGRDWLLALVAGAATFVLFVATLQPDFGGPEDTPKFQFLGHVLGTAHPPGYPLYVVLSHLFVKIPIGTIAYRANLFSAVMAALACALAHVMGRQIGASRYAAFLMSLALATGASFWRSAVFAEVYALAAVMATLTVALMLAWGQRGRTAPLLGAAFAFGLGLGNHLTIVGLSPAIAAYLLWYRRALSVRVVVTAMLVILVAVAQYGFIIVRTRQGAPYLESSARTVPELVAIVTAERFETHRFAFGLKELLTVQVPLVWSVCQRDLGLAGVLLLGAGLIAAVWRRNVEAGLVVGGAVGMLGMVVNLYGDYAGFITPVMVFLWAVAALGVTAITDAVRSRIPARRAVAIVSLVATAAVPILHLKTNYRISDQSGQYDAARFMRRMYAQLPNHAGVVFEDYWYAMAVQYFVHAEGRGKDVVRVEVEGADVRRAAREGRRVFAFGGSATLLAAEGLQFERTAIVGPPLDEWLGHLPRGQVIVGATAYAAAPFDLASVGHAGARPIGRPRSFEAFALTVRSLDAVWRGDDVSASLAVHPPDFKPLPGLAGSLVVSANASGARIELAGRTVARVDTGLALAVFDRDGVFLRALEFQAGAHARVPFQEALYELTGETPCVTVTADGWTDLSPALSTGSWIAWLPETGSVVIDSTIDASRPVKTRSAVLMGDGVMRTVAGTLDGKALLTTELRRPTAGPSLFRLALDRAAGIGRARLKPGSTRSALVCQQRPMRLLFQPGAEVAVLGPDFESEAYFGAGWSDSRRSPTGPVRHGGSEATLLLPLESGRYRVALDLVAEGATIDVALNGAVVGACAPVRTDGCEVTLDVLREGVSAVTLSVRGSSTPSLTFRGARIHRQAIQSISTRELPGTPP